MSRKEFTKLVRQLAFGRAKGHCEKCTAKLFPGKFDYDHEIPYEFGGESTVENCKVLCKNCHSQKTFTKDIPDIAKSNRILNKRKGITAKKKSWGYGRDDKYKMKLNGKLVLRIRDMLVPSMRRL